jgi:uncharacterized repeat protein (TIGR01451 family)
MLSRCGTRPADERRAPARAPSSDPIGSARTAAYTCSPLFARSRPLRATGVYRLRLRTAGLALAIGLVGPLSAQGRAQAATPAGTRIVNVAAVIFNEAGGQASVPSNTASLIVLEELGVTLDRIGEGPIHAGNGLVTAVPFELTNAGNGHEAFALTGTLADIDGQVVGFALDTNGDGRYDAGIDTPIDAGGISPMLEAGAGVRMLALIKSGSSDGQGTLTIATHAVTGSGRPGTVFAGAGDGGSDAIVGATTAAASIAVPITATADATTAMLVKSQVVLAPDGSDRPVHGATITYTIAARIDGTGSAAASVISDPIPEGTTYVPGSLRLNSTALTDAGDGDAGQFNGSQIQVALGDVVAPATDTISFQVTIQ